MKQGPFDLSVTPIHIPDSTGSPTVPLDDFKFDGPSFEAYIGAHCEDGPGRLMMIETTPGGNPASSIKRANPSIGTGAISEAFKTTVQPAASAGPSFVAVRNICAFHGTMAATTPTTTIFAILEYFMGFPPRAGQVPRRSSYKCASSRRRCFTA